MLVCVSMLECDQGTPRATFAEALERYLGETLHARIYVRAINCPSNLPGFLDRTYDFYETMIADNRCVIVAARDHAATPADVAKHVHLVSSSVEAIVVYAAQSLSAHNRSRLIAQAVAFVVPGNQLYIPELAMDLREHFRAPRTRPTDGLSPAAQAVLFHHLLRLDEFETTPSSIAQRLRYSPMSIGRAFDDLVAVGLARTLRDGKQRHLYFNADRRTLMEGARTLLRSPVRGVKYFRNGRQIAGMKLAGESALARLTDLSWARMETVAIATGEWRAAARAFDNREVEECDANFTVETWSYDPAGLSDGPLVDPLSLYAQFWDHGHERVAMAADSLLERIPW